MLYNNFPYPNNWLCLIGRRERSLGFKMGGTRSHFGACNFKSDRLDIRTHTHFSPLSIHPQTSPPDIIPLSKSNITPRHNAVPIREPFSLQHLQNGLASGWTPHLQVAPPPWRCLWRVAYRRLHRLQVCHTSLTKTYLSSSRIIPTPDHILPPREATTRERHPSQSVREISTKRLYKVSEQHNA